MKAGGGEVSGERGGAGCGWGVEKVPTGEKSGSYGGGEGQQSRLIFSSSADFFSAPPPPY